jgi:beta-N-acetylhexosaminidase
VDCTLQRLTEVELVPFAAAVQAGVGSVMSSHVVFPVLDPDHPATLSPVVIPRLLRQQIGFDGVVFSDDMDMKAVSGRWPVDRQVDLGPRASIDVFLACESLSLQLEMFEALVQIQERDGGHDDAARDAVGRVTALRERFLLGQPPQPTLEMVGRLEHRMLAEQTKQRGLA